MADQELQQLEGSDESVSDTDTSVTSEEELCGAKCAKLKLSESIAAYLDRRELVRDAEPLTCDNGLIEKVMLNYIIAKKILSNLCWQDKLLCKHVCSTWHSALNTLAKEQMAPADFAFCKHDWGLPKFKTSNDFYNEPLAVFVFTNTLGLNIAMACENISLCHCSPKCQGTSHCLMDVIQQHVAAPKNCMLTVVANYLSYMPLPNSITVQQTRRRYHMVKAINPFIGGIHIPKIPNVEFHVLNIKQKTRNLIDLREDFYDAIDKLSPTRIFKGALVYVTEKYILHTVEDIVFLNYLKEVQPDIPYALGGCIVEETMFKKDDIDVLIDKIKVGQDFVSENLLSIALFTVPKAAYNSGDEDKYNFDMFSLVIESSEWTKPKVQLAINEFAKKVPNFEHSIVLKLSCVGRDQKHDVEQDYFRAAFPNTPLIGCYGNGELGINHPTRPPPDFPHKVKRHRGDSGPEGIMYSYSTVFVYMGWGKITPDTAMSKKSV